MPSVPRVLIALAVLVVPAAVAAQPTRARPATEEVPLAPGWVFTPSVGLGGGWDNNVLLASEGDSQLTDYGTPVDSGLSLDYRGRRLNLSGRYNGSFVMYRTYDDLNTVDQRARLAMEYRATARLKVFAEEYFIEAPSTDVLNVTGVPFYRTGSRTNEAGGGVEALVARHTTLVATYTLRSVSFDEQPGQQLDEGHEHDWTVSLARARSTRLTLGAQYNLRREVFSDPPNRFNIQQGGATAQYALTPTLAVSGLLGVAVLGASQTHDGRVGPAIEAQLLYRARDTSASASYQRSFVPAFGFGGTFQNEQWVGSVHLPISTTRLYVEGSLAWFVNEPIEEGQASLQSLWMSGTGGYRASRWLTVEVYADRSSQDSQTPGGKVRRAVIGFRVVVAKPMRLRGVI
jgi:hypothetical protein